MKYTWASLTMYSLWYFYDTISLPSFPVSLSLSLNFVSINIMRAKFKERESLDTARGHPGRGWARIQLRMVMGG